MVIKTQSGEISDILEPLVKECVPIPGKMEDKNGENRVEIDELLENVSGYRSFCGCY